MNLKDIKNSLKIIKLPKFSQIFVTFFAFFALLANTTPVFAQNDINARPANNSQFPYTIENYRIDMIVDEDKTYHITEKIDVFFHKPRHGIFRTIPLEKQISRTPQNENFQCAPNTKCTDSPTSSSNLTYDTEYAQISHLFVNHPFTTENTIKSTKTTTKTIKHKQIKIGDKNKTLTGPHSYIIKYDFKTRSLAPDHNSNFYFNLIGLGWNTIIRHVDFSITMPKSFDSKLIGFSSGDAGSKGYNPDYLKYNVTDNTITGSYSNPLYPHQALTIRANLPNNYFNYNYNLNLRLHIFAILIAVCVILFIFVYSKLIKNPKRTVETVEFYPPENLNSLDLALVYYGYFSHKHILSLLVYLASKGYLKIIDLTPKKSFFKKSPNFKIIRLKKYDGKNPEEKLFMSGLFQNSKTDSEGNIYTTKSLLRGKFYATFDKIGDSIRSSGKNREFFEIEQSNLATFFVFLIFVATSFFGHLIFSVNLLSSDDAITHSFLSTIPVFFIAFFIASYFKKRTIRGVELLGKIRGFRRFLQIAEKPDLEALVESDPTYFYKILPYTYVLDLSDKWIKKFESIDVQPVDWYSCNNSNLTNIVALNSFINSNFTSSSNFIASSGSFTSSSSGSSNNGGSGFSGGSYSGGGSGGGGGGSW